MGADGASSFSPGETPACIFCLVAWQLLSRPKVPDDEETKTGEKAENAGVALLRRSPFSATPMRRQLRSRAEVNAARICSETIKTNMA